LILLTSSSWLLPAYTTQNSPPPIAAIISHQRSIL
jgi:hypothetical protein